MPCSTRVRTVDSAPRPIPETDRNRKHTYLTNGACPTSTQRQRRHEAWATTRVTRTTTWSNGRVTTDYVDACTCVHCGFTWMDEWGWL